MMKLLFLSPHTDDVELSCGGTISKYIKKGDDVYVVAFSPSGNSTIKESKNAIKHLGLPESNHILFDYKIRHFPEQRQKILHTMFELESKLKPDMVIIPCPADTHQDHETISKEGFRVFKKITLLGFEAPWNNLTFHTNVFITFDEDCLIRKINAVQEYKTQSHKSFINAEFIKSLAIIRARQIGSNIYAECYQALRWII